MCLLLYESFVCLLDQLWQYALHLSPAPELVKGDPTVPTGPGRTLSDSLVVTPTAASANLHRLCDISRCVGFFLHGYGTKKVLCTGARLEETTSCLADSQNTGHLVPVF